MNAYRWGDLRPDLFNTRVVLPSGRIVHVISTVALGPDLLVRLRDDTGRTRDINVNPDDFALLPTPDTEDAVVASLRERFPDVEFLRRI